MRLTHEQNSLAQTGVQSIKSSIQLLATQLIDAALDKASSSQIEWTMFNEMTITELCFNFFSVFLVISLIPFFVILILKSEAKQAEF
jgi:hypothetical protein